jgi:hypothetical protein
MASEPAEPQIDKDPRNFDPAFLAAFTRWEYLMSQRQFYIAIIDGKRTVARQKWLYASGRTRSGLIVTKCDGVRIKSKHQAGRAADCWARASNGSIHCPGPLSAFWSEFVACAKLAGLKTLEGMGDLAHLEMPDKVA